jgi:small conductance mechanosensitive channel
MQLLQISVNADQIAQTTSSYVQKITDMALSYAPKIIGAIIIYLFGNWMIGKMIHVMKKLFEKKKYDPSLHTFLISFVKVMLTILLFITIASILGVDTTAFGALMVGAGVAIGSALNGTLGNFAGGVMMLIFKPFKIGDMIEAQGTTGMVTEQGVFSTTVLTAENKTVYVPNGPLSTGIITNYTTHGSLRVDFIMAISLDQDIEMAKKVSIEALLTHPKVLKDPKPAVNVLKVGDGMVTLSIQPYCVQSDYWAVYFGCTELVKKAWDIAGIEGPTQQKSVVNKQG